MTRTAVLICPGRGTYNKPELGYLHRHHGNKAALFAGFDALRAAAGQEEVTTLDGAERFSVATYSRGDIASPLIYAASLADAQSLASDIEVVAVTGNSMGWYIALAAAGALSADDGFTVVNTMGTLMQEQLIGGQLVYPFTGGDWQDDPARKAALLAQVAEINARAGHDLALSINLGGMLVLAGNEAGLAAFEAAVPVVDERFPMRLANHAAFHTALQAPVAAEGRKRLDAQMFTQPEVPLIDGRGQVWWPGATDTQALWDYTLGHQVVEAYDFTRAIQNAALEFAPDLFIVTGPGTTLGGAVAQSLVHTGWQGMTGKEAFKARQAEAPLLISMGDDAQRALVTG
ncbi:ACP S-malonyltransferase [Phaeobacter sp. QD34_3]|uniref:ACP S-malonyltransferase n=1 Tax=unclassified Phaeobacter TaxID=2621772 RepID=UPI00237F74D4|nr:MULTISPECIES: ACP S-malonyltransferase [unclassified Phaeobacter]MDE4132264.1 ACP S-malonyltransferase [Phaeobacter sp. QD34_3]MDE4135902.1 ACP S-malonyltransferase [Phaeobacter sp. QD34_24]